MSTKNTPQEPTSINVHYTQKLVELYGSKISAKSYLQNIGIAANLIHAIDAGIEIKPEPNTIIIK